MINLKIPIFTFSEIKMRFFLKVICFYFLFFSISNAKIYNEEISFLVKEYLKGKNISNSFEINKKLRLPSCEGKIEIENKFKSYKTLLIKCTGDNKWNYNLRTNIKSFKKNKKKNLKKNNEKKVFIVKHDLKKNHIITRNDIILRNIRNLGSNNYFHKEGELLNRVLKIPLKSNQIIRERHLIKIWTIQEGQKVIIENNRRKVSIMVNGIATKSAMKGDYLEVLNESSGKKIKAWVINSKKVSIFR